MRYLLASLLMMLPLAAQAGKVGITEKTLQKGVWEDAECRHTELESEMNDPEYHSTLKCLCAADIQYVVLSGIPNAEKINAVILEKARASQNDGVEKTSQPACHGKKVPEPKDVAGYTQYTFGVEKRFENNQLLVLDLLSWSYGEGAAHGNGWSEGLIIDKQSGTILTNADILDASSYKALNQSIFDALGAMDESFQGACNRDGNDAILCESKAPAYLTLNGRNMGSLYAGKEGLVIQFSPYAVGPYSSGDIEVPIPEKFVKHPAIKKLYGAKHAGG